MSLVPRKEYEVEKRRAAEDKTRSTLTELAEVNERVQELNTQLEESKKREKEMEGNKNLCVYKILFASLKRNYCGKNVFIFVLSHTESTRRQEEDFKTEHLKSETNVAHLEKKISTMEKELSRRPPITFEKLLEKIGYAFRRLICTHFSLIDPPT